MTAPQYPGVSSNGRSDLLRIPILGGGDGESVLIIPYSDHQKKKFECSNGVESLLIIEKAATIYLSQLYRSGGKGKLHHYNNLLLIMRSMVFDNSGSS